MFYAKESGLMESIRKGDKDAFAELAEPVIAKAYQSAFAILRSRHLAEEAVQNALIDAYQAIMDGKEISNFAPWFRCVIAKRAADLIRKEIRNKNKLDIEKVKLFDPGATPMEEVLKKERSDQLLEAVMSLDAEQRAVIVLYYFQELSIEEISDILHLSASNVKTRLHRARKNLGRFISSTFYNEKAVRV